MAGMVHEHGECLMLEAFVREPLVLKLFSNNYKPDAQELYEEAKFSGYGPITLSPKNWKTAARESIHAKVVFRSDMGGQNHKVYGYFIVHQPSGKIVAGERFADAPYAVTNNGDEIKIAPKIARA